VKRRRLRKSFEFEGTPVRRGSIGDGKPAPYRQIARIDLRYTDEIEPLLARTRCPISLLWGDKDAWIAVNNGRAVAERVGPSRIRIVSSSGHLMQEHPPEAIVAEAFSFFHLGPADSCQ
jgi:pimeloyl-ACP methyl ester carboxylesterase